MIQEIGGRVKELRKERHFSQHDLAGKLGLSQGMLSSIENQKSGLSLSNVRKICDIFDVSSEWLIYGRGQSGRQSEDYIPLVDKKAAAGYVETLAAPSRLEEFGPYKIPGFLSGNYRLFDIADDQMYPTLEETDVVICERMEDKDSIKGGTLCAMICADGLWVKRIYTDENDPSCYSFQNDNNVYAPKSVPKAAVREAWRVKSKITSSFLKTSLEQTQRFERLEGEVNRLKLQYGELLAAYGGAS